MLGGEQKQVLELTYGRVSNLKYRSVCIFSKTVVFMRAHV